MKTLIAIPCMQSVPTPFFRSVLGMQIPVTHEDYVEFTMTENSLIYDARNIMAHKAVENGFDRVLWLDSDMVFDPDIYIRLSSWLDMGLEYVSGLYFKRNGAPLPVVYKDVGFIEKDGDKVPSATPYIDYPAGLFEVAATGLGGCMMSVDLIRDVKNEYGLPFSPVLGFGEDLSFCKRVRELGRKMHCDSTIKMAHIAHRHITEENFRRYMNEQAGTISTGTV